jgi:acetate kinase
MKILSLNPGSSSLKAKLFLVDGGEPRELRSWKKSVSSASEFGALLREILADLGKLDAVGCRVVDGGPNLRKTCFATDEVVQHLVEAAEEAPLHSQESLDVIHALKKDPNSPQIVLVFDSTFHLTIPPRAAAYALPESVTKKFSITNRWWPPLRVPTHFRRDSSLRI